VAQPLRWVWPTVDHQERLARDLARDLGVHPIAARVLVNRGYPTAPQAQAFLDDGLTSLPDPFRMKGLALAVERIQAALVRKERVTLWGDYDVDGVCSTALLTHFLGELGLAVRTYIPHRLGEGYGLNVSALERLAREGTQLLITLDCGITSHAEISRANALGLDVIVVDHHAVPDTMPPAVAVLNPLQPGCDYPTKWLCAGGVTFNLCMALRKTLRDAGAFGSRPEPNLKQLLDLVALATVADVVPLTGANRIFVRHGLDVLTNAHRPGIRALKEVSQLAGARISSGHVGFRLGPRINAAGRLDDASVGLQLLLSKDLTEARPLASKLDAANAERQQIERSMLQGAIEQARGYVDAGAHGLVLAQEGWHPGVVGIVASRVVEHFHRPTVLIGSHDGSWRGSARSIDGFHLYDALKTCAHHLSRFGGHKAAAGLSIEPAELERFRASFQEVTKTRLTTDQLIPKQRVDAVVAPHEIDLKVVDALGQLAPFGMGNPEPVLASQKVVVRSIRVLENKTPGLPGHLKLSLEEAPALDCIGFGFAPVAPPSSAELDLAFQVSVDEYLGVPRVGLKLKALQVRADVRASAD
jgi:single-stranded-DNA-specific exonuclease